MQGLAPKREKQAWKAECIERCPLGLGKGGLETCQRPEYGNGECRFNRSRQPFWRRGNALATYFMKGQESMGLSHGCSMLCEDLYLIPVPSSLITCAT